MSRPPLVRCEACEFAWYGEGAAHGLSILGHCSRCGGKLSFRRRPALADRVVAVAELNPEPSRVLGLPR